MTTELNVLIIGATGVFGSRLAERAAREPGLRLTLAARRSGPLAALASFLGDAVQTRLLDRDTLTALDLAGQDVVIDAAGPFQASSLRVVEAALAAGVDYIDLADGRDFVAQVQALSPVARGAGVAVVTGASSVPALSHAVIDALTAGWTIIDRLRVGIHPGNRASRGLAVVEAILSYTGRPVRLFLDGRWQQRHGWGLLHRAAIPGVGRRWASLCDTPDLDLLVSRYHPVRSAEFYAGLELSILHVGLWLLSWPVRWGWIASLRGAARPLLWLAQWLLPFGSDIGAMQVDASGRDATGRPVSASWTLRADGNRGPYVPTLAALALLRRYRDGILPSPGAYPCCGILTIADFAADFMALGITTTDAASIQTR